MYKQLRDADFLNDQWRVSEGQRDRRPPSNILMIMMDSSSPGPGLLSFLFCGGLVVLTPCRPPSRVCPNHASYVQHSLTRVSVGLALILLFKIYRTLQDHPPPTTKDLLTHLLTDLRIESTGVLLALLITDFIRKARPSLPSSFWLALLVSLVEFYMWVEVARQPGYRLTMDSHLPIGAFYFLFTWGSHVLMERTVLNAQDGVRRGEALAEKVNNARANGKKET